MISGGTIFHHPENFYLVLSHLSIILSIHVKTIHKEIIRKHCLHLFIFSILVLITTFIANLFQLIFSLKYVTWIHKLSTVTPSGALTLIYGVGFHIEININVVLLLVCLFFFFFFCGRNSFVRLVVN